jgi:hypothetical protein
MEHTIHLKPESIVHLAEETKEDQEEGGRIRDYTVLESGTGNSPNP